jgi:hypothetical protein
MWWFLGIPALLIALLLALSRRRAFLWLSAIASFVGIVVGYLEFTGLPDDARITPVLMMFSVGALVFSLLGISASRRDGGHYIAISLNAGAGATLVITTWLCIDQVRAAYVPGLDSPWLARISLPMLLAIGLVSAVDGITRIVKPQAE